MKGKSYAKNHGTDQVTVTQSTKSITRKAPKQVRRDSQLWHRDSESCWQQQYGFTAPLHFRNHETSPTSSVWQTEFTTPLAVPVGFKMASYPRGGARRPLEPVNRFVFCCKWSSEGESSHRSVLAGCRTAAGETSPYFEASFAHHKNLIALTGFLIANCSIDWRNRLDQSVSV